MWFLKKNSGHKLYKGAVSARIIGFLHFYAHGGVYKEGFVNLQSRFVNLISGSYKARFPASLYTFAGLVAAREIWPVAAREMWPVAVPLADLVGFICVGLP